MHFCGPAQPKEKIDGVFFFLVNLCMAQTLQTFQLRCTHVCNYRDLDFSRSCCAAECSLSLFPAAVRQLVSRTTGSLMRMSDSPDKKLVIFPLWVTAPVQQKTKTTVTANPDPLAVLRM